MSHSRKTSSGLDRRRFLASATALGGALMWAPDMGLAAPASGLDWDKPPLDARPMARWWWFGGAVEADEIRREIRAMKAGGFGGFEIQPVYPLSVDDAKAGIRNKPYLSPEFLAMVSEAARTGREEGLRVDLTLGSGWPFGGPHISAENAASRVLRQELAVAGGLERLELPALEAGQRYLAVFVGAAADSAEPVEIDGSTAVFAARPEARTLYLVLQGRTGQQVKRPSVGSEGLVVDHLSHKAVRTHLEAVGEPLLAAFGDDRPYAIFSDSLEVYGTNWTDDLLPEFRARRGYDLTPHLMKLFTDHPDAAAVRYDWGLTLSELVNERYLMQVTAWAKTRQTLFRSQTYGIPAVTLSSNRLVDLAEGEGSDWRGLTSSRWASSANHIYGQAVTSAESFTWLHKGAFRATPLDIKAEADVLLLQGINQFIVHGWPYTPPKVAEPGWSLYAAAVFNDHNPWWPVMADVNLYLQRLSHLMRQGRNVAGVAIYVPSEDIMSDFRAVRDVSINDELRRHYPRAVIESLIDGGYNFDLIDGEAILSKGIHCPVLLLTHIEHIEPIVYERIRQWVAAGGIVLSLGAPPSRAAGLKDREARTRQVADISQALFGGPQARAIVTDEAGLVASLNRVSKPDLSGAPSGVGYVHRELAGGHLYFVANTTPAPLRMVLGFDVPQQSGQVWEPVTGAVHPFRQGDEIALAPFESVIVAFGDGVQRADAVPQVTAGRSQPLNDGWQFRATDKGRATALKQFASWTDTRALAHHSGKGTYSRTLDLSAEDLAAASIALDFGAGTASTTPERKGSGYYAPFDAPVRDAAEVFVNNRRVGAVWCAPYRLELKPYLTAGRNVIEVRVYNTAINALAGQPEADYTLLNATYGERFKPQNMDNLRPLPSGLLEAPTLHFGK